MPDAAGSVYIQDSRSRHASPLHNWGRCRIAVVNRWCPWWLSVDDFAPGDRFTPSIALPARGPAALAPGSRGDRAVAADS